MFAIRNKLKFKFFNLIVISLILLNNYFYIYAQEATGSAEISPTESATPNPESTSEPTPGPFEEATPTPTPTFEPSLQPTGAPTNNAFLQDISPTLDPTSVPTITPNILESPAPELSASIRTPIKSYLISKSHLTGGQSLAVGVLNAKDVELKTSLFSDGEDVEMQVQKKVVGDTVILLIDPPVSFTPGKYRLKITDPSGHTEEQNFLWGVLAINTDKSIYSPKEEAKLGFTVLDEEGKIVCDATLKLEIRNPKSEIEILSTENGKIKKTSQCSKKTTNRTPDYSVSYQVGEAGTYNLDLTAVTKNGTYSIIDSFEVKSEVLFAVDRQDFPTRLNPSENVELGLRIKANQDFAGSIVEAVPDVIQVASSSATPYDWIATGVSKTDDLLTGADSPLIIRYPFEGNYPVTLKFGEEVEDKQERSLYAKYGLKGHDGVDFALPEGTPVLAVDDGEVILAGGGAYGVTVVLQHTWGRSYYGHLSGTGHNLGDKVLKGDGIGLSGKTGLATGPHLHFGIKFNNPDMSNGYYGKVDPWRYLTGSSILPGFSVRLIGWNVSLKKGETKELSYKIDAPDVSPQFYLFGPLRFFADKDAEKTPIDADNPFVLGSANNRLKSTIFSESRQWQMAVDAVEQTASQPQVARAREGVRKPERSIISKGKPVNTNLRENAKALARSRGEKVAGVDDDDKLFRWEVELPHGTTFGFGLQETERIRPVVRIRNKEGWYVEFEPNLPELPKVKPKVNGNQIEWPISEGITARYTALKDRIKADYIVRDKSALDQLNLPAGEAGQRLSFQMRYNDIILPDNPDPTQFTEEDIKNAGQLTHELLPDGNIVWLMENSMTAFVHPVPKISDSSGNEFNGTYEITKNSQGTSFLSINLPRYKIDSAVFPITIDPVTIDNNVGVTTTTAYANARKIVKDAWGNLIVLIVSSSGGGDIFYKNYNSTTWINSGFNVTDWGSMDIDSSGNLHITGNNSGALPNRIVYYKATVSRNTDNTISSMSGGQVLTLDSSDVAYRSSLIVANKGEGAGKEKVAVAWASNSSKNPKQGEIRFAQCDVADGCDTAAEWKNASEQFNLSGTCSDSSRTGVPNASNCAGGTDPLFRVAVSTTHHAVLTQVPGRPARTPKTVKRFSSSVFTTQSNMFDDNTGTTGSIDSFTANEYIYVGDDTKFSRLIIDVTNTNSNSALLDAKEYCSANSDTSTICDTWTPVSNPIDNTATTTSTLNEDGSILFDEPSNWVLSTEGTVQGYFMRIEPAALFDSTVSIAEIDVTDRHSKDLLIVGGPDSTADLGTSYVIWDFITQAGWENIPGNTTAPAPWRETTSGISGNGALWSFYTNFPLTIASDQINNNIYLAYADSGLGALIVKRLPNTKAPVFTNWPSVSFPDVAEGVDIVLSLTSDQNDIYLFYVLDPGTNALVYRKCDPRGGGTRDICDNASDWSSEKTLDNDTTLSHPQAVFSKAFGDTPDPTDGRKPAAIDVVYTDTTDSDVRYERHFVDMADKTVTVAANTDDAHQYDCDSGADTQVTSSSVMYLGRQTGVSGCSGGGEANIHSGFRFPGVTVSQGETISSAYLDFRVTQQSSTAIDFTVYGHDIDTAPAFDISTLIESKTRTTSSTDYTSSNAIDFETNSYRLEVTDIVQEIVCQGLPTAQPCIGNFFEDSGEEWTSGNALALLLISSEGGASANFASITAFDDPSTTMLDPTLQINLGNTGKRYSMGVDMTLTNSRSDLVHPMETEEFSGVNTDDSVYASVSASLVPSASSSASPIFMFKVNNTNNNNTDDLSATAIIKSSIRTNTVGSHTGRPIFLQLFDSSAGWVTKGAEGATAADTDITLSSGTVSSATTNYATEAPGGSCSGSDCWVAWRIYQEVAPEGNEILYVDNFSTTFMSPTPTQAAGPTMDQLLHHGAWFNASGVEQPFTF